MAEAYLVDDRHLNVADWELVTASSKEQPGARIDHNFEWKGRHLSIGDGDSRISVTIKGDEVGGYNVWLRVPEAFERHFAEQRSRAGFFNDLSFMSGAVGFGLAGLLAFLIAVWRGSQRWYAGLRPALAIAAVALFAGLNRLPLVTTGYQTTQDYTLFWLQQIFDLLYLCGLIAAVIFVTWPGGQSLSKQVWSHRDKILPRQGDRWETLARSSWRGFMLAGIRSGYGVIFYLVVTQLLGGWVPLDNPYTALFATPLPFLGPLAGGLIPAMSEEPLFRLVGISLILWLTGRRWLALLVPGVLWAFAHLAYVRDPFYLCGLELTVVAVLYGLFFLRFDLTTVVVAHFTYNASLGILPLIRSGEPYFVASGLIIIAVMLIPVLPGLVRTGRRWRRQIPDRPPPQIRLADSNDLKAIARLPVETLDWSTLITDPDNALLCLQSSDELIGLTAGRIMREGQSEVLAIYVAPGWRRRYWGSRLVEALGVELAARGGASVQVTVAADDRVCTAFWASQGWRPAVQRFTSSLTAPAHPHWRGLLKQLKTVFRQ